MYYGPLHLVGDFLHIPKDLSYEGPVAPCGKVLELL